MVVLVVPVAIPGSLELVASAVLRVRVASVVPQVPTVLLVLT